MGVLHFDSFLSLTKIALISLFDVPYNAKFYSPAMICAAQIE